MSKSKQPKPGGKSGQRAAKLDPPQSPKSDRAPGPDPKSASQPDGIKPIEAAAAAAVAVTAPPVVTSPSVATCDGFPVRNAGPANASSIDFPSIAVAYGDYAKKSFEQTRAFVEKLAGVRSLDKAIEIQTEFAQQAYETFVQESRKICELYSGLARQSFEGAVATVMPAAR